VCQAGANFIEGTPAQLSALRAAVSPVCEAIERGAGNRAALERIEKLEGDGRPDTLNCARRGHRTPKAEQAAPELDGTYRTSFSEEQLAESPLVDAGEINDENWGDLTLRLARGRFQWTQRNARASSKISAAAYSTDGDMARMESGTGERFAFRWSPYRGTLQFERDETLGVAPIWAVLKPWQRVD
jgi:hypothetical protein